MLHAFSRTELLLGTEGVKRLKESKVAIFGIGGVGSFTVEGLARAGIGRFVLVDDDTVCLTNLNRQLHATTKTIGLPKVEVMRNRILEINPQAEVEIHQRFYLPACGEELVRNDYDYLVDAVDTVTAKIDLIERAMTHGIPVISCMGAGNKLDPTRFEVADLSRTSVCPLARVMRRELRQRGIEHVKVVYSTEEAMTPLESEESGDAGGIDYPDHASRTGPCKRRIPGSVSFVPSVAGLILAGEVVRDLLELNRKI